MKRRIKKCKFDLFYNFLVFRNKKFRNFQDLEYFLLKNKTKNRSSSKNNNNVLTNDSLYSNSPFSYKKEIAKINKSKSMKKLSELQDEFKIEIKSKNHVLNFPNNHSLSKNKIYDNYTKSCLNTNKLIRNSSMCTFRKNNPLNEKILNTENKSKYIPRNNSKILRDINKVKETIEGNYNDGVKELFRNYETNNNFYKKNNQKNNIYINSPFNKKKDKKYIFSTKLLDEDNFNYQHLKYILSERNKGFENTLSTIHSNNNSFYNNLNKRNNRNKFFLHFETENEFRYLTNNLNKL